MGHVATMTFTAALGLMAMFMVDLLDLYFLSLLKDTAVTAAIGFAGAIAFANLSMSIGTGIAAAALVARHLGAGDAARARDYAGSTFTFSLLLSALLSLLIALFSPVMLRGLGASGEALVLAQRFIWTVTPGFILSAGAIACSFILRGLGDARRAMFITLTSAAVTVVMDPLFILHFGFGMQGAAIANVIAYAVQLLVGLHGVMRVHQFLPRPGLAALRRDLAPILAIAIPAVLTQLATPFANAFVTAAVAPFGDAAVAASAIIGRVIPVAFGIIFALSGAVGPIIGQNFGARQMARVRRTLDDGLIFSGLYTLATSLLLFLFRHHIAALFGAAGRTAELVVFFTTFIAVSWAFAGAQFVANAAFNNLGHPQLSTLTNWGKATLGTIPFAWVGAKAYGPEGILMGTALGSVIFGIASVVMAYRIVAGLENRPA